MFNSSKCVRKILILDSLWNTTKMFHVSHQAVSDYYRNSIALLFLGFLERRR
jgi:hypothetical protein